MKNEDIENLAKRYCKYLGLSIKCRYDPVLECYVVVVWPSDLPLESSRCVFYGWDALFFGETDNSNTGLSPTAFDDDSNMCLCRRAWFRLPTVFNDIGWFRVESRIIEADSLEELDLQLSIRGFQENERPEERG